MYLLQRPLKPQMELSSDELAAALVTAHWFQKQVTTQATADRKPMPKAAICVSILSIKLYLFYDDNFNHSVLQNRKVQIRAAGQIKLLNVLIVAKIKKIAS